MKKSRILLSLFLFFHLLAVLVLPNPDSIVGRRVVGLVASYASTLGINTTWRFFSPGPSPTFFLEYTTMKQTADGDFEESEPLLYPPAKADYTFDDFYARRLYGMRFLTLDEDRMIRIFGPFLCRQHPDAAEIRVQYIFEKTPDIDAHSLGTSFENWAQRFELNPKRIVCASRGTP